MLHAQGFAGKIAFLVVVCDVRVLCTLCCVAPALISHNTLWASPIPVMSLLLLRRTSFVLLCLRFQIISANGSTLVSVVLVSECLSSSLSSVLYFFVCNCRSK